MGISVGLYLIEFVLYAKIHFGCWVMPHSIMHCLFGCCYMSHHERMKGYNLVNLPINAYAWHSIMVHSNWFACYDKVCRKDQGIAYCTHCFNEPERVIYTGFTVSVHMSVCLSVCPFICGWNHVCCVSSTIQAGFILFSYISTNFRRYVAR